MSDYDDALVEKAAEAIYGEQRDVGGHGDPEWVDVASRFQDIYRNEARAVLDAVAPTIRADALEEAADEIGDATEAAWLRERAASAEAWDKEAAMALAPPRHKCTNGGTGWHWCTGAT